jgi:hypothetical protein
MQPEARVMLPKSIAKDAFQPAPVALTMESAFGVNSTRYDGRRPLRGENIDG